MPHSKRFTDTELAAELWRSIVAFNDAVWLEDLFEDEAHTEQVEIARERMFAVQSFCDRNHYDEG